MDTRFGTWNVRNMNRAGSLTTVAEETSKYKLDLVGVQEVSWGRDGTEPAGSFFVNMRCLENELPLLLVAIPCFRRCLPKRCLAMDYSVTLYWREIHFMKFFVMSFSEWKQALNEFKLLLISS
jgi:hypothetical protein